MPSCGDTCSATYAGVGCRLSMRRRAKDSTEASRKRQHPATNEHPAKPYAPFPLFPYRNGQRAKKRQMESDELSRKAFAGYYRRRVRGQTNSLKLPDILF